jgi:glycosyltransferase involved in cell wall biosynthesis
VTELSYAVVTPVRDEAENLERLATCMLAQTRRPREWLIVDTGSSDATPEIATRLAAEQSWIRIVSAPDGDKAVRGAPVVRAFEYGVQALNASPDVVVKLDADVSMGAPYFAAIVSAFERDPSLGIASGRAFELRDGEWKPQHVTRTSVWGASRAYRRACLADVSPLDARMGWDGIDEVKANLRGWRTQTFTDLRFDHHRREGSRDGLRTRPWRAQGELAHYLGYRPSYILLRTVHRFRTDLAAAAMLWGYAGAAVRRSPRCDIEVRTYLRERQRWREVPARAREALGRRRS